MKTYSEKVALNSLVKYKRDKHYCNIVLKSSERAFKTSRAIIQGKSRKRFISDIRIAISTLLKFNSVLPNYIAQAINRDRTTAYNHFIQHENLYNTNAEYTSIYNSLLSHFNELKETTPQPKETDLNYISNLILS